MTLPGTDAVLGHMSVLQGVVYNSSPGHRGSKLAKPTKTADLADLLQLETTSQENLLKAVSPSTLYYAIILTQWSQPSVNPSVDPAGS